jgi:hypothetical protein
MSAESRPSSFDTKLRSQLLESFVRLERLNVLPERDLATIYSSCPAPQTVRRVPRPTVRQLNARFSNL